MSQTTFDPSIWPFDEHGGRCFGGAASPVDPLRRHEPRQDDVVLRHHADPIGQLLPAVLSDNEFFVGRQVARVTGGNGGYISSGFTVGILLAHLLLRLIVH